MKHVVFAVAGLLALIGLQAEPLIPDPDDSGHWGKFPAHIKGLFTHKTNTTAVGDGGVEFGYIDRGTYENPLYELFIVNRRPDIDVRVTIATYAGESLSGSCLHMTYSSLGFVKRQRLGGISLPTTIEVIAPDKTSRKKKAKVEELVEGPDQPTGKLGEKSTNSDKSSRSIGRNDDTRITSDGRINAASASEQLLTSSGLPCTEYVVNVVAASGININEKIPNQDYTIKDAININSKVLKVADNEDLAHLVFLGSLNSSGTRPIQGVVYALVAAKKGVPVDIKNGVSALRRGDLVQYWYRDAENRMLGHAAVVRQEMGPDGKVTLIGSQQGKEGEFRTKLSAAHSAYAVRPSR